MFRAKPAIVRVDWENGELRKSPRASRPNQREMFFHVFRADGSDQWLRRHDIHFSEPAPTAAEKLIEPVLTPNTELVRGAKKFVISYPANMGFEAKPKRLQHMAAFIAAAPEYTPIDAPGFEKAFVDRLFAEGMLERHPENSSLYRPTSGGVLWFRKHNS